MFYLCAAQRLMQALGAYGNLSRNQGKPQFTKHIPAAIENLRHVCDQHGGTPSERVGMVPELCPRHRKKQHEYSKAKAWETPLDLRFKP
jgi:aminoglycoside/choline kinase family phosphotransferase